MTFAVQWIFCGLLRCLPKSFTIGEAAVVGQGLTLFLFKSLALDLPRVMLVGDAPQPELDDEVAVTRIIELGVLLIFLLIGLMRVVGKRIQNLFLFAGLLGLIVIVIIGTPITQPIPIIFVLEFLLYDPDKVRGIIFDIIQVTLINVISLFLPDNRLDHLWSPSNGHRCLYSLACIQWTTHIDCVEEILPHCHRNCLPDRSPIPEIGPFPGRWSGLFYHITLGSDSRWSS